MDTDEYVEKAKEDAKKVEDEKDVKPPVKNLEVKEGVVDIKEVEVKPVEPKKPEMSKEEKDKLLKQQEYFKTLQRGAYFISFVHQDIEKMKKEQIDRSQRRRLAKDLRKGIFSKELVEVYMEKIEQINQYIEDQLNPKPVPVDGVKFYEKAKQEAEEERENLDAFEKNLKCVGTKIDPTEDTKEEIKGDLIEESKEEDQKDVEDALKQSEVTEENKECKKDCEVCKVEEDK